MRFFVFLFIFALQGLSNLSAQIGFIPLAGLNLSGASLTRNNTPWQTQLLPAYHLGGIVDYSFGGNLSIQSHLLFSLKGYGYKLNTTRYQHFINSIEVPVSLKYAIPIDMAELSFFAGTYVGMALSGKEKVKYVDPSKTDESGDLLIAEDGDYKSLDAGIVLGAGWEVAQTLIQMRYCIGTLNYSAKSNIFVQNRVFELSVGYRLKKSRRYRR